MHRTVALLTMAATACPPPRPIVVEPNIEDMKAREHFQQQLAAIKAGRPTHFDEDLEERDGYIDAVLECYAEADPEVEAVEGDCYSHSFGHYTEPVGLEARDYADLGPVGFALTCFNGGDLECEVELAKGATKDDPAIERWKEIILESDAASCVVSASRSDRW